MTGESHCASGKLIVSRIERTGRRGRPLSPHVEAWRLMRVCWADRHVFAGTETEWSDGSFRAKAFVDTVNQSLADHIDAVEANVDREVPLSSLNEVATDNARKMFCALTMLQGPALILLKKVERGNGFEAWRLLVERHDRANASRLHHMLQSIMRPKAFLHDAAGFEVALNEWERLVQHWEILASDLNDTVKRQIFLGMALVSELS